MVLDIYGEQPKLLKIFFPSNDMKEICNHEYVIRDSSGKKAGYGDGENFYLATPSDGTVKFQLWEKEVIESKFKNAEAFMSSISAKLKTNWAERLTLRFMIVGFPVLACWEFCSGGDDTTIPAIVGEIDRIMQGAGRVSQIPFDLSVKKVKSDKSGSNNAYPVVSIVCNFSPEDVDNLRQLPESISCFGLLTSEKVRTFTNNLPPPSEAKGLNYIENADFENIPE
jgi:hypothetical protein